MSVVEFSHDPIFAAIERHRAARAKRDLAGAEIRRAYRLADEMVFIGPNKGQAARRAFIERLIGDDEDDFVDPFCEQVWNTFVAFTKTVPTTLAGLAAMLKYAEALLADDDGASSDHSGALISSLATAARAVIGGAVMKRRRAPTGG